MQKSFGKLRTLLCVSTAFWMTGALPVAAQTAGNSAPIKMNLGTVVANSQRSGQAGSGGPSATGSLAQAHELKKLAPNIVSVQPQSEIQKLPDVNLAEALQRVPGLSMQTDSGTGRWISIRGLDPDLDGTSYDGVHLTAANQSTPTGGGRAVAFDAFPSGMVGGVEVTKTLEPQFDAEGIGGNVNLLPLSLPPGGGPLVSASVAAGQETLRHTGVYDGSLTIGDSFGVPGMKSFANATPFSLIINYTNHTDRRGIDDLEESYINNTASGPGNLPLSTIDFRYYNEHRVTQGFGGELDFDPDPTTHLYARALEGGYDEQINKNILHIDGLDGTNLASSTLSALGGGSFLATGAMAEKDFSLTNERINYQLAAVGGKKVIDDAVTVDFRGSWEQGLDDSTIAYSPVFLFGRPNHQKPFPILYNTANNVYRVVDTPTVDLTNPAKYYLENGQGNDTNTPSRTIDSELGTAADVAFATNIFGNIGEAKFGLAARFRTEGQEATEYDYGNLHPKPSLADLDGGNPNIVYFNNHYAIGPDVAYGPYFAALAPGSFNNQAALAGFGHNSENVYAAFGQETLEVGNWEFLTGVRAEDTNATYQAYAQTLNGDYAQNSALNENKQDYINFFPSFQAKYAFTDRLQVRAAYSTGIARPGFQQISAASSLTPNGAPNGENQVTVGNPSLKPETEDGFDVALEYYGRNGDIFSINPFYKFFQNYTVSTITEGTYLNQPAQITSYKNIGGAYLRGIEIEARRNFTFLPSPLDGFGVQGNVTFVDSSGKYDTDTTGTILLGANQLPQVTPIDYNAELYYEKGPLGVQLAANYAARSLYNVAAGGQSYDTFTSAAFGLDLNVSYQITPEWQMYAQGKNLTNTPLIFTQGPSSAYPIQHEFYESDYLVGIRYNLGGGPSGGGGDTGGSDD